MLTIMEILFKTLGFVNTWLILIVLSVLVIFSVEYFRLVFAPRYIGKSKKQRAAAIAERKAIKAREDEIAKRAYLAGLGESINDRKTMTTTTKE